MLKDIYTINGWYNNGQVTLLRNDRKQIPIDLDYVNKGFTWYNGSSYQDNAQYEPIDSGDDTPTQPDPQPGRDTPTVTKYSITVSNNTGGSISTNKSEVEYRGSATITIIINDGYKLNFLTINGINVTAHIQNSQYVINNITEDKTVYAEFSKNTQTTPTPENPDPTNPGEDPTEPITNEKFPVADAVDLGLPSGLKWASWNMGSSSPMDVPDTKYARYGWGDPTGEVQSLYAGDYLISQNTSFHNGNIIDIAGTQYDIATVQWGTGWRLPRQSDFEELIRECTAERGTFTDANGVSHYGIKFIGPNGRSILLPAAGLRNSKGNLVSDNSLCAYWASTNLNNVSVPIPIVYSTSLSVDSKGPIYYQLAIRPVYEETSGSSSGSGGGESGGESGGEPGGESGGDSGQTQPETPSAGNAVDLGLSIYWADRNVGSSSASNVGYYIPWGDTQSRSDYSQSTYIHYKNNAYVVTGLQPLPAQYDAASQVWGGDWRMPTMEEWSDLINYCDWVEEGDGFRVYKKGSTKKSESIYLPTSGYKITDKGSVTTMSRSYCTYWTSTLSTTVQYKGAKGMAFLGRPSSDYKTVTVYDRYQGMPIRPVKNK